MCKKIFLLLILASAYFAAKAQSLTLSGKVATMDSEVIAGATVSILNTNLKLVTDKQGGFTVRGLSAGTYQLEVRSVGYATVHKQVVLNNPDTPLTILLPEDNKQLDEVMVTAQKRDEDPQNLPLSISTLSAKKIQDYRLWNSRDLTAVIPNLYAANPGDNRNVTSVRGIANTSYDQSVATYIDGVNQFGLDTYIAQLEDVERIEVLRGPQGTLYGRNAMGGVINIITRQPGNDLKGFAGVDVGNYGEQRYNLGLRTPLIKDKLFLGVSGLYTQLSGFYTNQFSDSKFDKQNTYMGNYYLKFLASPRLGFTVNVKHNENRNNGTFPLSSGVEEALTSPFRLNQNAQTRMTDNVFNSSLSANYSGRSFNFSSQTAYQSNYRYYNQPIDGDFSPIDGISIINNYGHRWNTVKVLTQEFRFTSPATNSPFKWTAGTYAFYQHNPVKQGTHFGDDAELVGSPYPNVTSISTNTANGSGLAFYGNATYSISPKLDVNIGLRYDYEHKKLNVMREFQADGGPVMPDKADTSSSAGFHAFSPRAGMAYHIAKDQTVYASYNRGYRAGGLTQISSDDSQPPLYPYKPEYSNNFELGTKNTFWNNRIRLNASLFYTRVSDAQVPTLVLPDAVTVTRNAGKLTSKGAEAELAALPLKNLELDYNFGYTHARYTDLEVSSYGSVMSLQGNRQVFTPDITSMLALQYGYDLSKANRIKLVARGEWKLIGDQYFDLANRIGQKEYSLFNARLGVSTRNIDVFLWGSNLDNKTYIDYAYDFGAAHLGNPRTYGISVSTNFGR